MSFITDFDAIVDYPGLSPAELGFLMYFFRNQGESFIFYVRNIKKKFGIKDTAYSNVIHSLQDKDLISYTQMNEGQFGGIQIKINISRIRSGEQVTETGKPVHGKPVHGKPESGKTAYGESETGISVHGKSGHINGVNIEGSKSSKGVNGVREGDSVPAAPCDTLPAGTQTSLLPPDVPPAPVPDAPRNVNLSEIPNSSRIPAPEPRKRFTPPTVAEISQHISDKLQENNISWLPEQITGTAEIIFNFYDSKGWKVGKETMKNWKSCVSGWLGRDNWVSRVRPRQSQSQQLPVPSFPGMPVNQQAPKSFREQDRDYANRHLRDPFGTAISDCVDAAIIMGGDPCDYGLAPQFHEEAMKLMQQRKEQAAKGHNINPDEVLTPGNQR